MGIEVKTNVSVIRYSKGVSKTDKGDFVASTIIWTAGVKPTELGENLAFL